MTKSDKHSTENIINNFNQFDINKTVQSIWSESDIKLKKQRMIEEVISNFRYKQKQLYFTRQVKQCTTLQQLDKILANLVLYGEGLNSIKV